MYYVASNERMIVNDELEKIWKEAAVADYQACSRTIFKILRETTQEICQDNGPSGRVSKPGSHAYEAEVLVTKSQHLR
jgi:hypothetical protein